ncbi:hypothetical protein CGH86_23405 [Vibrio parahaemolyticus]|uniref:Uncharacterized protein n=2 Tax=Photobacterium aquae TaxID=1195763 RepID=A0A0J1GZS5_9GAMM|nr:MULTISPECIES: hypothetical protein [Vibrio harveyi group]EHI9275012.1 hypothetical protein [Vibrio vulnificus]KLV05123.1 hypothetical protein ABT56_13105 [Photobacterium aquae]ARR44236.1 hypothetical protein CAY59_07720 [Vibrio campbellii]EIT7146642.1 hypothetical protein [Vibrio vulnificus]TOF34172.1 hypothetical protein CGJ23_24425 [Vibrio parahaemolyticus]
MAAGDDVYREAQARLHRILGSYLSMYAWKSGADCVVIQREELLEFLELTRMKNVRVDWIKEDLKHLFRYAKTTVYSDSGNYAELYLSRTKFPKGICDEPLKTEQRIEKFKAHGLKLVDVSLPSEHELVSKMALILTGIGNM